MKTKRVLSLLLCVAMVVSLCAVSVFADDTTDSSFTVTDRNGNVSYYTSLDDVMDDVRDGGTITVLKDYVASDSCQHDIGSERNITLNLNNHTLNITTGAGYVFGIINGKMTVCGPGTIKSANNKEVFRVSGTAANSVLTIEKDVNLETVNNNAIYYFGSGAEVHLYGSAKTTGNYAAIQGIGDNIYDGGTKLFIYDGANVSADTTAIYTPQYDGEITITGGTITSAYSAIEIRRGTLNISGNPVLKTTATEYKSEYNGSGGTAKGAAVAIAPYDKNVTVNISGGTFEGVKSVASVNPNSVKGAEINVAITGGNFTGEILDDNSSVKVSGGTFDSDVKDYISDGYEAVANSDGTYTVQKKSEPTRLFEQIVVLRGATPWLFAAVDSLDYDKAGFKLTIENGETADVAASIVCDSVQSDDKTVTAANLGGAYLFGIKLDTSYRAAFSAVPYVDNYSGKTTYFSAATSGETSAE